MLACPGWSHPGCDPSASGGTADALASGASVRKDVGVQIPPRARQRLAPGPGPGAFVRGRHATTPIGPAVAVTTAVSSPSPVLLVPLRGPNPAKLAFTNKPIRSSASSWGGATCPRAAVIDSGDGIEPSSLGLALLRVLTGER